MVLRGRCPQIAAPALLAVAVAAAVAIAVALPAPFRSSSAPAPALRVVHGGGLPRLVDARGRTVLLHGVAVTGLVQYASDHAENPPIRMADLDEIAALGFALGFDFIRLPISWSRLEPRPGRIDTGYLDRVAAVTRAAAQRGLLVLVDLHFDRYNRRLAPRDEADGAPDWATLLPSGCPASATRSPACAQAAWQSFWADRPAAGRGVQQRYLGALLALSRALRPVRGVAGIELMNNPVAGDEPSPAFERDQLWPFLRRAISALRADGEQRPLWIDRAASGETADAVPSGLPSTLSPDPDLVLAAHDYAGVFAPPQWPAGGTAPLQRWYANAVGQARSLGMALVVGEWGAQAGGAWESLVAAKRALQDEAGIGSSFWMWKQRPGFYNWSLVDLDGGLRADSSRAQLLSRPYPRAISGLRSFAFDGRRLTVTVDGRGGTAVLWSGTEVLAGGPSAMPAPLTHAAVDGRTVPVALIPRAFRTAAVQLTGDVVRVRVPPGAHTLALS